MHVLMVEQARVVGVNVIVGRMEEFVVQSSSVRTVGEVANSPTSQEPEVPSSTHC